MKTLILTISTVLIVTVFFSSCGKQDSYKLYLLFDNVDGLTTKSEIKANGLLVGSIDKLELLKNKVLVTTTLNKTFTIPTHSTFEIQSTDLFGGKTIDIKLGNSTTAYKNNDTILGIVQPNLLSDSTTVKILQPLADTIANAIRDFGKTTENKKK